MSPLHTHAHTLSVSPIIRRGEKKIDKLSCQLFVLQKTDKHSTVQQYATSMPQFNQLAFFSEMY